jgi:hypothetical protein
MDTDVAEFKRVAGFEMADVRETSEPAVGCGQRLAGGINGYTEFALQDSAALDVVDVIVRNDDGLYVAYIPAVLGHPPCGTVSADSGVKQKACSVCLNVNAIAVGAGLYRKSPHQSRPPCEIKVPEMYARRGRVAIPTVEYRLATGTLAG